ncbi:hypothetical protein CXI78_23930 [Salmonella enterica]|uniref:hypothetical protein n=1 Tax=Klebsiella quasipneumoniae TaxID=1463165 RepID=UPI000876829B|nr:hypothetical protein [Klebsiella quasipneumoniae]EAR5546555.1 hypothetical protein [Salmonella enterica]ECJ7613638.1 hypothetical protein [Salmonella enterica subsp. enterica serovar Sandiego]EAS0841635.1 hypothetical protein [Salmonella enterica]EAT3231138.1 hypothetical protein [Salmonella enterica]EBG3636632.1 hypothetical protein [Salmonella enterica]
MNSIDEKIQKKSIELVQLFIERVKKENVNTRVKGVKATIIYDEVLTSGSVAISLDCITEGIENDWK